MSFGTRRANVLAIVLIGCKTAEPDIEPPAEPMAGVAAASEPASARAGAEILAAGGNAIDAAVAMMFMNTAVEPQGSGIGGGGFVLIHWSDSNETIALNCREAAPAATTADMFVSQPNAALRTSSGYAVGVPGMVACAAAMLEKWGTLTLAEALRPAIDAATTGIEVSDRLANDVWLPQLFSETTGVPAYAVAREVFHPDGIPVQTGDWLIQPDLAHTFELLAEFGPDAFYDCNHEAGIAQAIIEAQLTTRTNNPDGVGRMTCSDLAAYEVEIQQPISRSYRGYEIVTMPPPTAGGIALLQILAMLERFPIGDESEGFGFGDFATVNVMLEAVRLAFADRTLWVGDQECHDCGGMCEAEDLAGCTDVPVSGLLSDAYLAKRSALIEVGQRLTGIVAGELADGEKDTSHAVVVDADGNIVNFTMSIEATWGTGIMVPGYGFLLNNQLTDFNPVPTWNPDPMHFDPGANDPAPCKQPRSSMAPTIVFRDGEPVAAYGSPAGATIISTVTNMTLNLLDHRMTLWDAVSAPRMAITSASDTAVIEREPGFHPAVISDLQALGYLFNPIPTPIPIGIGAVQAIVVDPESGQQYGAADYRRIGGAVGVK